MAIKNGIEYNGKHSYHDFRLTIFSRQIGNPSKIKIKERVPFSNIVYDFSGIYGGQEYEERTLTYVFNLLDSTNKKVNYTALKDRVVNWLCEPSNKERLKDDTIIGYHFLAELESEANVVDNDTDGTLTVSFTAYSFKIADNFEGDDIWDTFNFLTDYVQETEFVVSGSKNITLYNAGIATVSPIISSTSTMQVVKNGITYNVPNGQSTSYDLTISPGENNLMINGTGTISFKFKKELI